MQKILQDKPIFDVFRTLTGPITPSEFADVKAAIAEYNRTGNDKQIFDTFRTMDLDGILSREEFGLVKRAIAAGAANDVDIGIVRSDSRDMSAAAIESLKKSEGCRLVAYPDPGSRDGHPWTIGYGATGPGIRRGIRWTQEQADARLVADIRRFEDQVEKILGDAPTTQAQFDAIVHFAYNIGTGALARSTFLKMHKAGDIAGAADQFRRWNKNDGKVLAGLVSRRRHEKDMYLGRVA